MDSSFVSACVVCLQAISSWIATQMEVVIYVTPKAIEIALRNTEVATMVCWHENFGESQQVGCTVLIQAWQYKFILLSTLPRY